ncbi:hypothetical protein [Micromonospora chalcea]|uniref:hypothetical protein n=1 Tax=Micromonospora chalcea TaxID=1874 RepID=UPI003CF7EFA3
MFGVWQPEHFVGVTSLDEWEDAVSEDEALLRHIEIGTFVPINIGGGGAYQFTVRYGDRCEGLTEREGRYRLVSSEPYLLIAKGQTALGGLEAVGQYSGIDPVVLPTEPGRYAVTVHLIDWKAEPGAAGSNGRPAANALPDFIIEVRPESGSEVYRSILATFERS